MWRLSRYLSRPQARSSHRRPSESEHVPPHGRRRCHLLLLHLHPQSTVPAAAACAARRQVACDTPFKSSMVNPSRPPSLCNLPPRKSPDLLWTSSHRRHNRRRLSKGRNLAGPPSRDRVPLRLHLRSCCLLCRCPPRWSHRSSPSILQVRQRVRTPKKTKIHSTWARMPPVVRARPGRASTTEVSPSTKWASGRSSVPRRRPRRLQHKPRAPRQRARP
jgi:hypothetical protein